MKTIKAHLKLVALFFSALIFFQGCTIYKSANVTLEEASKAETRVSIYTNDNQTLKFKRIGVENRNYYGVKKIKGEMIKTQIDEQNVEKVKLKDETLSTILTIALPVVIIGLAIYIIADKYSGFEFGSGNNWY